MSRRSERDATAIPLSRCTYFNSNGVRCSCRTETSLCPLHVEVVQSRKKPVHTCPVCLSRRTSFTWFECSHGLCSKCLPNMRTFDCPVCRQDFRRAVGSETRRAIHSTMKRDEEAKIQERMRRDAEMARRQQDEQRRNPYNGPLGEAIQIFFSPAEINLSTIFTLAAMGPQAFTADAYASYLYNGQHTHHHHHHHH